MLQLLYDEARTEAYYSEKYKDVRSQAKFCNELSNRLTSEVNESKKESREGYIYNKSRIKADILRLRRELKALNELVDSQCAEFR